MVAVSSTSTLFTLFSWMPISRWLSKSLDLTAAFFGFFKYIQFDRMTVLGQILYQTFSIIRVVVTWSTYLVFGTLNRNKKVPLPPITHPILLENAEKIAKKIRKRQISSEEVVKAFINRIKEVNPIINAMVDARFEAAVDEAKTTDRYLSQTALDEQTLAKEQPFLGVPYTIKENFQVKGLRQTVGLIARKNCVSAEDAELVVAMRNAGAILLGVTNLSELCTWWESRNNVYGQTNNPYDTTRIAGGSSGGEGSIVSAAGSLMGIGSDIGGSIRMPAFFNGVFGHKPSPGLVTNDGQLPKAEGDLAECLSTGPICRYATDLLPLMKILSGPKANIANLNKKVDIKTIKIYYMADDGGFPLVTGVSRELKMTQLKVVKYFKDKYGIQAKLVKFPAMARTLEMWAGKMTGGGAPSFCEEMLQRKGKINIYTEILKWVRGKSDHTFSAVALGFMEKVDVGRNKDEYNELLATCKKLKSDIQRVLRDDGVFLYPSFPVVAPYHYQPLLMPFNFTYPAVFNVVGLPVTQCPLGLGSEGLPLGIQVVANTENDHMCLAMAVELEKAFGGWVSPSEVEIF